MTGEPTYLFGVGATKAGTTWLYRYLHGHPDCHMRAVKELHFFNAAGQGAFDGRIARTETLAQQLTEEGETETRSWRVRRLMRDVQDLTDWVHVLRDRSIGAYRSYLADGRGTRRLVGDITPAYASLPAETLGRMAGLGRDVRFVYLLRDPMQRFWSHVRMVARREGGDYVTAADRVFERALSGGRSDVAERSDYRAALLRLRAAVAPSKLLVQFQEELMSVAGVQRLCEFLGIRPHAADFSTRVHEGQKLAMTAEQESRARAFLQPQYDYVASVFGTLPASWRATSDGVTG